MTPRKPNAYVIHIKVIDRLTKAGIGGIRVEAWDRDLIFDDLVGSDVSDPQGMITISFDESYYNRIFLDRRPDLYFKVFRDKEIILNTYEDTWWDVSESDINHKIEIDSLSTKEPVPIPTPVPAESAYRVHGFVRDGNNNPVKDFIVLASARQLRSPQQLGTSKTDATGAYSISYGQEDFQRGHAPLGRAPWLIVELRANESGEVLAKQEVQKAITA